MTPDKIYSACRGRYDAPEIPYVGPFGSTTYPYPGPEARMNRWINITLLSAGYYDNGYNAAELADFIARYATDKIKLTWWDRIKRWIR